MTVLERLQTLSDSLTNDTDNLDYVDTACVFFMNQLPESFAKEFFIEEEVPVNGLVCGKKYSSVIRVDNECRMIPASKKRLASKSSSQYFASDDDPVFYKENGMLFILPSPTTDKKGYVSKMPSSFIPDGANNTLESIPNIPDDAEYLVILYAGHLILYKKARDTRASFETYVNEISGILTNFNTKKPAIVPVISDFDFIDTVPSHPNIALSIAGYSVNFTDITDIADAVGVDVSDLDLTFDTSRLEESIANDDLAIDLSVDFSGLDVNINDDTFDLTIDLSSSPPSLDLTGITAPTVDLSDAVAAINKASDFIGTLTTEADGSQTPTQVPTGAFWLDDEDPEMVQSAAQLASQEINKGASLANAQLSTLEAYKSQIDAKIAEFRGHVEAYTSKNTLKATELESKLSLYKSKIDGKTTEVRAKVEVINAKLTELQAKLNKAIQKLQLDLQARDSSNQIIINREQLTVQEYSARIENYSVKLNKIVQREQLNLREWETRVNQEIQKNQLLIQQFQNELNSFSTKFQTQINEWSSNTEKEFKTFESKLNLAISELQSIQAISSKFQVSSQDYAALMQESQMLYEKYMNEFQMYLGVSNENN